MSEQTFYRVTVNGRMVGYNSDVDEISLAVADYLGDDDFEELLIASEEEPEGIPADFRMIGPRSNWKPWPEILVSSIMLLTLLVMGMALGTALYAHNDTYRDFVDAYQAGISAEEHGP